MFDLDGMCVVVTGASGGIGSAIAKILHVQGAILSLSGTRLDVLETLAASFGERTFVLPCTLDDAASVEQLIPKAESVMGRVDVLVNGAGIARDSLILRMKDIDWTKVLDVNLTAAFRLSRAAVRGMIRRRFGRIVNIASIIGVIGSAGQVNYAASKAGIIGMTKSLAVEVASRGVTVNCVAPGFIVTAMTDKLPEKQRSKLASIIPAGRLGSPEDVATAVLFLVSPESSYITGQILHINGGAL